MLFKLIATAADCKSFARAASMLAINAEVLISSRYLGEVTERVGEEMREQRDQRVEAYVHHRREPLTGSVPFKVMVAVDGGRVLTRAKGQGAGVRDVGWREDKIACLQILTGPSFSNDPHPNPPRCFLDRVRVRKIVQDIASHKGIRDYHADDPANSESTAMECSSQNIQADTNKDIGTATTMIADEHDEYMVSESRSWPPKRENRTCVASMTTSHEFGKMVAAEAYRRNFLEASHRAFLGDGLAYNWRIQQSWFPTFEAILDFVHALTYLHAASVVCAKSESEQWQLYVRWMTQSWQGRVSEVIKEMHKEQDLLLATLGEAPKSVSTSDPREVMRRTIGYLSNNESRMNYPEYRTQGLPVTSASVESLVKEFNYRVKGSEKSWNRGESPRSVSSEVESILQVRASVLSTDDRLRHHILSRPGCLFTRPSTQKKAATAQSR